jgi:hypothetical protein
METHHVKPPGSADKMAIRCFKCDCCDETSGLLYLHISDFEEDVFMEISIRGEALTALAFDLQSEMQFPKPGVDGGAQIISPPWFEDTDGDEDD